MKWVISRCISYVVDRKVIFIFSFLFFFLRTLLLEKYFYLRDERDLILTAISLAKTGKDLYGHSFPLIFDRISPQAPILGMYWAVPFIYLFNISSPLLVKFLYLLPSLFFPILIFELIYVLTKKKSISMLTAFVVSFSPWFFHIGRLGVEAHAAYFFCLLGLLLYLKKKKIVGVPLLIISFFFYQGIRPFIFIIIPYFEVWLYFINHEKRNIIKTISVIFIFLATIFGVYFGSMRIENSMNRGKAEVIFLNEEKLAEETDFLRFISDAPFEVREFFDNKMSIISDSVFHNFFKGIDLSYLFSTGDYVGIYANGITGQFFPFLIIFMILGIFYLANKKEYSYYFIASFIFIGLISSVINSYSLTFSFRSVFSLIGIGFLCAAGIINIYESVQKNRRYSVVVIFTILYLTSSVFFLYKYFFQNYNRINDSYNEQERNVADYLLKEQVKTLYVSNIHTYVLSYAANQKIVDINMFLTLQHELNIVKRYKLENHTFVQCNAAQIDIVGKKFPTSTIVEDVCLTSASKEFLDKYKSKNLIAIPTSFYEDLLINRNTKFYYFK